jgi:colanic acid/amylovoran biosynthesis glycosyltransferase
MTSNPVPTRIGYLVSEYPAISHTFILREVLALRQRAIAIEVASVNAPATLAAMTQSEQRESERTFYVKRVGALGALKALGYMLVRHPVALFRGLVSALSLAGANLPSIPLYCFYFIEAVILAKWMNEKHLTHIHVHFATPAATVALILTSIAPVTLSMTVHGPDEFYDVPGYLLKEKIAAAQFVVCISFFAESQLMRIAPGTSWDKFELGRLGVDCEHFGPRPRAQSNGPFRIICVGRLVSTKGQRILIESVERLIASGRELQLQLVGDGPDRKELEVLVREHGLSAHVIFEGSVNQDAIQDHYRAADVFVLASFAEGIPVVLMEAMAMQIPCIATCINGIPELIRDGVDGLLVAPADIEGMASAIARLLDDPALRESLGKAGRVRVQDNYEASKSADRLADIFRRRLGRAE